MLPPQYADVEEDVKESYQRSRHLHRSIGLISYTVAGVSIDSHARTPPPATYSPFKLSRTPQPLRAAPKRVSPAARYAGKVALSRRLQELNQRLVRSKAGKPDSAYSNSPVLDRLAYLSETTLQTEASEGESRKPPHVSLRSGRTQASLHLQSYSEYCDLHKYDLAKAPNSAKSVRKASQAIAKLEKLKKQINGLAILLQECPGGWNRDRKVLYRLEKHPAQRASILKNYKAVGRQNETRVNLAKVEESKKTASPQPRGSEAYRQIKQCADNFSNSQFQQSQKLIDILDRYELERPYLMQRKAHLLSQDQDLDPGRAIQRLEEHRKEADAARQERVHRARTQAKVYEDMLEHMRLQPGQPTEAELTCLELVRNLLEEGWALDTQVVERIREVLGDTAAQAGELLEMLEKACLSP